MICKICNKDHSVKSEGPLTVCEKREYFSAGSWGKDRNGKYRAFGTGERYQHEGAK